MELLSVLEQKITSLVEVVEKLHKNNEQLQLRNETLQKDIVALRAENVQLTDENLQLTTKLQGFLETSSAENKKLHDLYKEQEYTKQMVDDLIKTIGTLVEENQL